MGTVNIYTDGGYRNGIGGWGWWCQETDLSSNGTEIPSTNQRMELKAALEAINDHYDDEHIVIHSDSAYLVNCFGDRWWIKWVQHGWINRKGDDIANRDLWEPLLELVKSHGNIKFVKVAGHTDNVGNNKADALATFAIAGRMKERGDNDSTEAKS